MSNINNAMALENLYETVIEEDKKGLIDDDEVNRIAFETGLHADDDRDYILQKIAEDRFELYDSAPNQDPTLKELEARICACGELIEKCPDAYEHMTQGV